MLAVTRIHKSFLEGIFRRKLPSILIYLPFQNTYKFPIGIKTGEHAGHLIKQCPAKPNSSRYSKYEQVSSCMNTRDLLNETFYFFKEG